MEFVERDIEDCLERNPEVFAKYAQCTAMRESFKWCGRQVRVASGVIDLLGVYCSDPCVFVGGDAFGPEITFVVVEIKREQLKTGAIGQCVRYAHDVQVTMSHLCKGCRVRTQRVCIGVGHVPDNVMYEADASNVLIISAEPTFKLRGPWGWDDSKIVNDIDVNMESMESVMACIPHVFSVDQCDFEEMLEMERFRNEIGDTGTDEVQAVAEDAQGHAAGNDRTS